MYQGLSGSIRVYMRFILTQWIISIGNVDMTYFILKSQFFDRNRSFYSSEIVTDEKKCYPNKEFLMKNP